MAMDKETAEVADVTIKQLVDETERISRPSWLERLLMGLVVVTLAAFVLKFVVGVLRSL